MSHVPLTLPPAASAADGAMRPAPAAPRPSTACRRFNVRVISTPRVVLGTLNQAIIRAEQLDRMEGMVNRAKEAGARVLCGGELESGSRPDGGYALRARLPLVLAR